MSAETSQLVQARARYEARSSFSGSKPLGPEALWTGRHHGPKVRERERDLRDPREMDVWETRLSEERKEGRKAS